MKKRVVCLFLAVIMMFSLASFALADSKYMTANAIQTVFFEKKVSNSGVKIDQTVAGFNGNYSGTIWHMYSTTLESTSVTFTGSEGATPTTKYIYPRATSAGTNHQLQVENCAPFNIYVVYTYTLL